MITKKILVIYPQTLDTKIAVYQNNNWIFLKSVKLTPEEKEKCNTVMDEEIPRTEKIIRELRDNGIDITEIELIMARGGLIKPVNSGIYEINERLKKDLRDGVLGVHVTNLGGLIADRIAKKIPGARAYLADPDVVDELEEIARIEGHPLIERKSIFHALIHKFAGRTYAKSVNKKYEDLNLIVAHVGEGGLSVGAHQHGKVIDVNQAFDGDGSFSLSRSGTLSLGSVIDLCFSGKYTRKELRKMFFEEGGLVAYLGTKNINIIENRIKNGEKKAKLIIDALAYQLAKQIGSMYVVIGEPLDAIILSGNIFQSEYFTDLVKRRILKLGFVVVLPSISEMDALAANAVMIMKDEAEIHIYE